MTTYNEAFYASYAGDSEGSGAKVLSHLFATLKPKRMIDVGCGIGTWLKAASGLGDIDVTGIDGDYVKRDELLIPSERFHPVNLNAPVFEKEAGGYDLAITMEVAEHLQPSSSEGFVDFLTGLSDVVLFSAAVPHQGGTDHINERWPSEWGRMFAERGFAMCDVVRPAFWGDEDVKYYYAQNAFVYVRRERLAEFPEWAAVEIPPDHWSLKAISFRKWEVANDPRRTSMRFVAKALPHALTSFTKHRIDKIFGRSF